MVAKLGSLTQRMQSLSSASTLVYSQLSLLQLSRAAASGQYVCMHTYTCTVHLTNSVAGSTHAHMHVYMDANLAHGHMATSVLFSTWHSRSRSPLQLHAGAEAV